MSSYSVEVLADPSVLQKMQLGRLYRLLRTDSTYFEGRGIPRDPPADPDEAFFARVAKVLEVPDSKIPAALAERINSIDALAHPEYFDSLWTALQAVRRQQLRGQVQGQEPVQESGDPPTPADVAVDIWFDAQETAFAILTKASLRARRSYENFAISGAGHLRRLTDEEHAAFEAGLAEHYEKIGTTGSAKVFILPDESETWFVIRHGKPMHIEGAIAGREVERMAYFPAHHDVVAISHDGDVMRINAASWKTVDYLEFDLPTRVFSGSVKLARRRVSLRPLTMDLTRALSVTGFEERISWVKLKSIRYKAGAVLFTERADANLATEYPNGLQLQRRMHPGKLLEATLEIKMKSRGSGRAPPPRAVTLTEGESATRFTRDQDASLLEGWLTNRGYM